MFIAAHCNTLQRNAAYSNALQHTATYVSTLERTATRYITLQHTATHCNTLPHMYQHTPLIPDVSGKHHTATYCNIPQHTATHVSTHDTSSQTCPGRKRQTCSSQILTSLGGELSLFSIQAMKSALSASASTAIGTCCVCVCVYVCVCVCVIAWRCSLPCLLVPPLLLALVVCERETERGGEGEREREFV